MDGATSLCVSLSLRLWKGFGCFVNNKAKSKTNLVALKEEMGPPGLVLPPGSPVGLRTGLALTLPEPIVESLMEAKPLP